jgi:protein gp37
MGENTKIEWASHTFNPWMGCTKVSPACDHCYAEVSTAVRSTEARTGKKLWAGARHRTANWTGPVRWDREAAAAGKRARVFCASLADVFDNVVPPAWRVDLFRLIAETPNLDWLLLTKRIGNAWPMMLQVSEACMGGQEPLPNVWLGATVVNQAEADRDIPKLLATPARIRFLSIEPMLGPMDLRPYLKPLCDAGSIPAPGGGRTCPRCNGHRMRGGCLQVDWVIVGGESGPHARPMHPAWVRSIRDQCAAAGVPFHFKQWGEWAPHDQVSHDGRAEYARKNRGIFKDIGSISVTKYGKKLAGRMLDGVTHDGAPVVIWPGRSDPNTWRKS